MDTVNSIIDTVSQAASSTFESSYDVARKGFGKGTNEHVSITNTLDQEDGFDLPRPHFSTHSTTSEYISGHDRQQRMLGELLILQPPPPHRARPSYPAESLQYIQSSLSPNAKSRPEGLNIIELGSGTGLFSRILLSPPSDAYPRFNIHSLYAVEPSEGMRSQWTKKYDESVQQGSFDPRSVKGEVRTLNGGFTDLSGLKERLREKGEEREWADLVIMAQAWHWAHPDYDAAIVSFQLGGGPVGHSGTERAGFERFAGL